MSETKWTPGEWKLTFDPEFAYVRADHHGQVSKSYRGGPNPEFNAANEANARLIAAAPELYAALDELFREAMKAMTTGNSNLAVAHERARSALSKARGETE